MRPAARLALLLPLLLLLHPAAPIAPATRPTRQVAKSDGSVERFSCHGRPAGFYADVVSECQMYHMCDEAGRLFTHACPERTRFQQRTMVCDHWYMVQCDATDAAPAALPTPRPQRPPRRHSQRVPATFPYRRGNESVSTPPFPRARSTTEAAAHELAFSPTTSQPSRALSHVYVAYSTAAPAQQRLQPSAAPPAFSSSPPPPRRPPPASAARARTLDAPAPPPRGTPAQQYKDNPFFAPYFHNALVTPTTSAPLVTRTPDYRDAFEDEDAGNKIEIVIPDHRKMFYIHDPKYDPGDVAGDQSNAVLVIDLPLPYRRQGKMKFQRHADDHSRNPFCPQCHPSYVLPGQCHPCVIIK